MCNSPTVYAKHSTLQRRDNEYTVDNYLELIRWKRFPKIMDVGCGNGITTLEVLEPRLPPDYVKLVGSDSQEKMVEFSKDLTKNLTRNYRIDFIQLNISAEKIPPGKYDHIFSFFAFHWVAKLSKGFENMYNMLTPGGDMLFNLVSEIPYYDLVKRQLEHPTWAPYFSRDMIPPCHNCRNPERLFRMHLKEAGFTNIKVFTEEREFVYENWVQCLKFFLAVEPVISKLDIEQKEEYIVDFFFTLRDIFSDYEKPNGEIRMPYKLLVGYASKPE